MNSLVYLNVLAIFFIVCVYGKIDGNVNLDFSVDNVNYVDPFDMLNYDRKALDQRKETLEEELSEIPEAILEEVSEIPGKAVSVKLLQKSAIEDVCTSNPFVEKEKPFLGRFVRILSTTLNLENRIMRDGEILHIPLMAKISKHSKFIIEEVLKDGEEIKLKKLADLDDVLSNILAPNYEQSRSLSRSVLLAFLEVFNFQNFHIKDYLPTIFVFGICTVLWWIFCGYSVPFIVSRSILVFFLLSWFWHYVYMSQQSLAKRQSDMMKHADFPASCKPTDIAWGSYFLSFLWKSLDPCEEYHRTFFTDPTHEVNPFTALVDMLVVAVFQPLAFIGECLGIFFNNILTSADFFNKVPVLFASLFIVALILIMCFRYEIALPLIKIGPTSMVNQQILQSSRNISQVRPSILLDGAGSQVQSIESNRAEQDTDEIEDPGFNARAVIELGQTSNMAEELFEEISQPIPSHTSKGRKHVTLTFIEANTQTLKGGFTHESFEKGTQTTEEDFELESHEEFLIV